MHLVIGGNKVLKIVFVLYGIAGQQDILAAWIKHRKQHNLIVRLCRPRKRSPRRIRRGERCLPT
jgi:hypothetical protein